MTIHFFTKGSDKVPSSRQRAFLVAQEFQRYQIDSIIHPPPVELISQTPWPAKGTWILSVIKTLFSFKKGDVLYLQRTIYNKYFFVIIVLYILFSRTKTVFDFDDAIYLHSPVKTKILTYLADAVVVGNHVLMEYAKKYNKNVHLIPTCTHFNFKEKTSYFKKGAGNPLVVGWVGNGPAHRDNLRLFSEVLRAMEGQNIPLRVVLIGVNNSEEIQSFFNGLKDTIMEFIDWLPPEAVGEKVLTFDIGVMPLIDTPWNRGKSALKAVEYMACGVATIASPVGENSYLISDGQTGFLPPTTEEWVRTIRHLYEHPELLETIGKKGREVILKQYVFDVQVMRLLDIITK